MEIMMPGMHWEKKCVAVKASNFIDLCRPLMQTIGNDYMSIANIKMTFGEASKMASIIGMMSYQNRRHYYG